MKSPQITQPRGLLLAGPRLRPRLRPPGPPALTPRGAAAPGDRHRRSPLAAGPGRVGPRCAARRCAEAAAVGMAEAVGRSHAAPRRPLPAVPPPAAPPPRAQPGCGPARRAALLPCLLAKAGLAPPSSGLGTPCGRSVGRRVPAVVGAGLGIVPESLSPLTGNHPVLFQC